MSLFDNVTPDQIDAVNAEVTSNTVVKDGRVFLAADLVDDMLKTSAMTYLLKGDVEVVQGLAVIATGFIDIRDRALSLVG